MSLFSDYTHDIFISYEWKDNINIFEPTKSGWVDFFQTQLSKLIKQKIDYEPKIWAEGHQPTSNNQLSVAKINSSRLLIIVVSPQYLKSSWFESEMQRFLANRPAGKADSPQRVFKVLRNQLPANIQTLEPESLRKLDGYVFYPKPWSAAEDQYSETLNRLADDISKTLLEFKGAAKKEWDDKLHQNMRAYLEMQNAPTAASIPIQDKAKVPAQPGAHQVVISYSSKDPKVAREVYTFLKAAGIQSWMADEDILPGEDYAGVIARAIKSSRLLLLIFTANANTSKHVRSEIDLAYNKNKPIILLRLDDTILSESLEYYLGTGSWLNASEPPLSMHLERLVDKVKQLLNRESV
jgi:hypothetical protein